MDIEYIADAEQLARWADRHGLRIDWHEPDEQNVDARVIGGHLDNAFGASGHDRFPEAAHGLIRSLHDELRVVLITDADNADRRPAAIVNLASLLAWASEPSRLTGSRDDNVAAILGAADPERKVAELIHRTTGEKRQLGSKLSNLIRKVADAFGRPVDGFDYDDAVSTLVNFDSGDRIRWCVNHGASTWGALAEFCWVVREAKASRPTVGNDKCTFVDKRLSDV